MIELVEIIFTLGSTVSSKMMSSNFVSISDLCNNLELQIERNGTNYMEVAGNQIMECLSKCQRPCSRWKYDIEVNRLPISLNSGVTQRLLKAFHAEAYAHIELILTNQLDVAVYEQVPTYNFHSFLSNIGGQISLWCGASIVSVVHLMHFIIDRLLWRKRQLKL